MHKEVYGWSLKRAGAGMTLTGKTAGGAPVRQPDVKKVEVVSGAILAQLKDGTIWQLCLGTPLKPRNW